MGIPKVVTRFWWAIVSVAGLAVALAVVLPATQAHSADHLDAPLASADGRTDINDVYAFQSPDPDVNTVLIMTVNPDAGVLTPDTFDHKTKYRFLIDNNGDISPDLTLEVKFGKPKKNGVQQVEVKAKAAKGASKAAKKMAKGIKGKGKTGQDIPLKNGGALHAGTFDDPFFADVAGIVSAIGGAPVFTGDNFAGKNVSGIVLEIPSAALVDGGGPVISVWSTTSKKKNTIDRMGKPGINTLLIPAASKDTFNASAPIGDVVTWSADVEASISFLSGLDGSGCTPGESAFIAGLLLPDVLTLDTSSAAGFVPGLNGRQLSEDVIDFELVVLTGGLCTVNLPDETAVLTSDGVPANDVGFPGSFPYLASPH